MTRQFGDDDDPLLRTVLADLCLVLEKQIIDANDAKARADAREDRRETKDASGISGDFNELSLTK